MMVESEKHGLDESLCRGVWIVIPAYNEAMTIRSLAQKALDQCPRVIVIDDGSTDGTSDQLHDLPVILFKNEVNQGKATCLRMAFEYALNEGAECVISMDGDGQHNPSDAIRLLSAWRSWPTHIVIGTRLHDRHSFPAKRYYANRVACFWISWASGHAIADTQSGFRVYPAEVMRIVMRSRVNSLGFVFESELLIEAAKQGWHTIGVPIDGNYPKNARPSHFRPVADITKIVFMVAGKLILQGMAPLGLYRSLQPARMIAENKDQSPLKACMQPIDND